MITTISPVNINHHTQLHFFLVMRALRISSLSNFKHAIVKGHKIQRHRKDTNQMMRGAWPDFQNGYHMKTVLKKQKEFARRPVEGRRQQSELSDLQGVRSSRSSRKCRKQRNRQKRNYSWKSPKSCLKQAVRFSLKPWRRRQLHTTVCDCATAERNICAA